MNLDGEHARAITAAANLAGIEERFTLAQAALAHAVAPGQDLVNAFLAAETALEVARTEAARLLNAYRTSDNAQFTNPPSDRANTMSSLMRVVYYHESNNKPIVSYNIVTKQKNSNFLKKYKY
jgi:hypothetical protein